MTGYSFTTPVWEGGRWVIPAIAEVRAAPKANGPEGQPRKPSRNSESNTTSSRPRPLRCTPSPVLLAVVALVQQVASGSGSDFVTSILNGAAAAFGGR